MIAEYYIKGGQKNKSVMKKIRQFSHQLAQLDLPYQEPYFHYIITHWPNESGDKESNTEYFETYDEDLIFR